MIDDVKEDLIHTLSFILLIDPLKSLLSTQPPKHQQLLCRLSCHQPNTFTKETPFLPIWEVDDWLETVEEPSEATRLIECDTAKVEVEKSKARTAVLAHEAESSILELQRLIRKTTTDTATHVEKDHLISLNSKLCALKKDIEDAKTVEKDLELKLLRSIAISKVTKVKLAMKEKDIRRALHAVQSAESVDIAFVIDCTGSMASYIASVKDSIQNIVERIRATNRNLSVRLAVVGYRDIDDYPRFEVLDFVDSIDSFKSFLADLRVPGVLMPQKTWLRQSRK